MKKGLLILVSMLINVSAFAVTEQECSKEQLLTYYPKPFVLETLKKFNVPKDQWDAIKQELSAKDEEVIRLVEEKASKMQPNPLEDPNQKQEAVKLFRETLYEVFSDVMYAHGVTDKKQIQDMLNDILQQKAKRFVECMKKKQ